jgi:type IV pilus assembly protein PilQ
MKTFKILLCLMLLAQQTILPAASAFAQAADQNNAFLQDMQGGAGDEGGPILEEPAPRQAAPASAPAASFQGNTPGMPLDTSQGGDFPKDTPMYEDVEAVSPLDRKIGPIRLKGAPLSTFLDVISAQSKVNFIISEGVESKTITVFLRKTTVREALEILLSVKGLTYQRIGKSNTYVVQRRSANTPNLITKVYTLNYIPLIPIGSTQQESNAITSQDVSSVMSSMSSQSEQSGGGNSREKGGSAVGGAGSVAIIDIVRSVLSKSNGKIAVDARTNTLIITDVPEVFPQVEQIIAELDKKAPQILIEAQIVEINTDRMNELGIEWGGSRGEMAFFQGPARVTDYGLRPGFFSGDQWKYFFPNTTDITGLGGTSSGGTSGGTSGGASGGTSSSLGVYGQSTQGVMYGVFSLAQLQAIFRALISKGEARYLGKPKIVAMNNKTALIQIARDAAMGTTSNISGTSGTATSSIERKRIGLTLMVTPQVNKEGYVTLIVQPSYSDSVASAITVQGTTVYDSISRGASTMVRVKNGQTVVIGGMLSSTETKSVKKVPLLGYIPIVGWLFTSVSSRRTNTDLVIFVTPTILVD